MSTAVIMAMAAGGLAWSAMLAISTDDSIGLGVGVVGVFGFGALLVRYWMRASTEDRRLSTERARYDTLLTRLEEAITNMARAEAERDLAAIKVSELTKVNHELNHRIMELVEQRSNVDSQRQWPDPTRAHPSTDE